MLKRLVVTVTLVMVAFNGLTVAGVAGPGDFLKLGGGARAAAMGDSFIGLADDASAIYWNPAGLVNLKSPEMCAMYYQFPALMQQNYMFVGFGMPMKGGLWVGAMVNTLTMPSIEIWDLDGTSKPSITPSSLAAGLGVAKQINEKMSVGAVGKYVSSKITEAAVAYAGDAGILYAMDANTTIGLGVRNVGTGFKYTEATTEDKLPMTICAGAAYTKKMSEESTLKVVGEVNKIDEAMKAGVGAEYGVNKMIVVRGGYIVMGDKDRSYTAGAGINFQGIKIDFSYVPHKTLGDMITASVGYSFKTK